MFRYSGLNTNYNDLVVRVFDFQGWPMSRHLTEAHRYPIYNRGLPAVLARFDRLIAYGEANDNHEPSDECISKWENDDFETSRQRREASNV